MQVKDIGYLAVSHLTLFIYMIIRKLNDPYLIWATYILGLIAILLLSIVPEVYSEKKFLLFLYTLAVTVFITARLLASVIYTLILPIAVQQLGLLVYLTKAESEEGTTYSSVIYIFLLLSLNVLFILI